MGRRLSAAVATAALFAAFSLIVAIGNGVPAWAQVCPGHPACVGGTYHSDGYCYSGPGVGGSLDHWQATCADGETLDRASGTCRPRTCGGSSFSCREAPVCPSGTTYTGASGAQGVCEARSGLNYRDHQLVPCPSGWTLDASRGVCRYCPALHVSGGPRPIALLPDLTFRATWLELPGSNVHVKAVHRGHAYLACFVVANVGSAPSGSFRVAGGGLGLTTSPYQDHASLPTGASRQGCLNYPTTPGSGSYKLGLEADSLHVVHESNEGNNEAVIPVVVIP